MEYFKYCELYANKEDAKRVDYQMASVAIFDCEYVMIKWYTDVTTTYVKGSVTTNLSFKEFMNQIVTGDMILVSYDVDEKQRRVVTLERDKLCTQHIDT